MNNRMLLVAVLVASQSDIADRHRQVAVALLVDDVQDLDGAFPRQLVFRSRRGPEAEHELPRVHFGKQFPAHLPAHQPDQHPARDQVNRHHAPAMPDRRLHDPHEAGEEALEEPLLVRAFPVCLTSQTESTGTSVLESK